MTMETTTSLQEETMSQLQELIQINIDACNGLDEAASAVNDPEVASLFRQTATDRRQFADELKAYVAINGETPVQQPSFGSKVHQAWMNVRAKLNGGDPHVVLIEAEFGEDQIKRAYEAALQDNPGNAMSDLLHSQYSVVKASHDKIRDMRDRCAMK